MEVKQILAHFEKKLTDFRIWVNKVVDEQNKKLKTIQDYMINTLDSHKKLINDFTASGEGTSYISIPTKVNVKVNSEFKIYYRNVISLKSAQFWVGYNNNLTTHYYDEYMTITPTAEGSHTLPWKVCDDKDNLISNGNITIVATQKNANNTTTVLVLGDSTVNAGAMTQKVLELYNADEASLTLLGTRGVAPNLHEGRGGWTAKMYCTVVSSGSIDNPFYNNGFDFSYYMNNQGYSDVQCVVIQLGINDIFAFLEYDWRPYDSASVLGYFDTIINSILNYDSNIKIILNLPITPNSNGTSFTEAYGTTQIYWVYNRNIIRFAEELQKHYGSNSSITISASNCILDTKTQIRDGVHPTEEGYNLLGQRLYEVLINIADGVAMSILNLLRGDAIGSTNTISATSPRELDVSKCYYCNMSGGRSFIISNNASSEDAYITTFNPISENSVSFTIRLANGSGVEYPVQLDSSKTYTLKYTVNNNSRIYLLKYNSDTTFNSYKLINELSGTRTYTITPEEGYLYTIMFAPFVVGEECIYSDVSLEENA